MHLIAYNVAHLGRPRTVFVGMTSSAAQLHPWEDVAEHFYLKLLQRNTPCPTIAAFTKMDCYVKSRALLIE